MFCKKNKLLRSQYMDQKEQKLKEQSVELSARQKKLIAFRDQLILKNIKLQSDIEKYNVEKAELKQKEAGLLSQQINLREKEERLLAAKEKIKAEIMQKAAVVLSRQANLQEKEEQFLIKIEKAEAFDEELKQKEAALLSQQANLQEEEKRLQSEIQRINVYETALEQQEADLLKQQTNMQERKEWLLSAIEKNEEINAEIKQKKEELEKTQNELKQKEESLKERENKIKTQEDITVIQVGLDYGTSTIKAVIYNFEQNTHIPVIFDHSMEDYPPYCFPCVAAFDKDNRLLLAAEAVKVLGKSAWYNGMRRFKMLVAANVEESFHSDQDLSAFNSYKEQFDTELDITPEDLTVLVIANAMRQCRIFIKSQPEYLDKKLRINFNICMPLDQFENEKIRDRFESLFNEAKKLERYWFDSFSNRFDMLRILNELREKNPDWEKQDDTVSSIPECVAGMAAFMKSLELKDGIYAIIDFGDGTIDVSICNICKDATVPQSWYAARCIPKGMASVASLIAESINAESSGNFILSDILQNYLNSEEYCTGDLHVNIIRYLRGIHDSQEYKRDAWGQAYGLHSKHLSAWRKNVKIFKTGGGSVYKQIDQVFQIPWDGNLEQQNVLYPVGILPKPRNFITDRTNVPFHMMAVAYGLSFPKPLLDNFTLPNETPDQTPPSLPMIEIDIDDNYM